MSTTAVTRSPHGVRGYSVRALLLLIVPATVVTGTTVFIGLSRFVVGLAAAATFAGLTAFVAVGLLRLCTYTLRVEHDPDRGILDIVRHSWGGTRRDRIAVGDLTSWYYLEAIQALTFVCRDRRPLRFVLHVPGTSPAAGDSAPRITTWLAHGPLGPLRDTDHEVRGDRRARRRLMTGFGVGVPLVGAALGWGLAKIFG